MTVCYHLLVTKQGWLLKEKIPGDRYNSLIFDKAGREDLYIVGGYLRDILRGIDSRDRDFVIRGDPLSFAKRIQNIIGGTIIVFKIKDTVRLALKSGYTFDFSQFLETIEENLSMRDFTINALAWSPKRGLIDLYNGTKDIKKRLIRCIAQRNMIDDPLRMLRAYRFSAELNGTVDELTRKINRRYHMQLPSCSAERITLEMFHLLNTDNSSRHIEMVLKDGLLGAIISLSYNKLSKNIKLLHKFEKTVLHHLPSYIKVLLHAVFSQNLSFKGLLSLHMLFGYECLVTPHLTMSRRILNRLDTVNKGIHDLKKINTIEHGNLFDIFRNSGEAALDILILSNKLTLLKELKRFQKIWGKGLLNPQEIMEISQIRKGPEIGRLIMACKKAQFEGRVRSKDRAISFVRKEIRNII